MDKYFAFGRAAGYEAPSWMFQYSMKNAEKDEEKDTEKDTENNKERK